MGGTGRWTGRWLRGVAAAGVALLATGCVERILVVRSDPPGALVIVDGVEAGETGAERPVILPFETYGTRVVTVRKPGFVPRRREVPLDPPWYQYPPLDLFSDLLWPGTIEDVHEVELRLERRPTPAADPEALIERAEHFGDTMERRP